MLSQYPIRCTIPATDLARAKKFYTETLGFKALSEDPEDVRLVSGGVECDAPAAGPRRSRRGRWTTSKRR